MEAGMKKNWRQMVMAFLADSEAAVSSEHALLITLIAMVIFAGVTLFGNTVYTRLYQTSLALLPFGS